MVATHFKQILKSLDNWWLLGETSRSAETTEHWVTTTWVKGTLSDSHSTKRKENRFIYRTTATVAHAGIETGSRPNRYTLDHLTLCGKQSYNKPVFDYPGTPKQLILWSQNYLLFLLERDKVEKREGGEKYAFFTFPCSLFQCWMRFIWLIGAQLECRSNSRNGKLNKTPENSENSSSYELKPCMP